MSHAVDWGRIPPGKARRIRSASPERTEPNSLLNHETSDHLLSLVDSQCDVAAASGMWVIRVELARLIRG
jgi:hypothetical protein